MASKTIIWTALIVTSCAASAVSAPPENSLAVEAESLATDKMKVTDYENASGGKVVLPMMRDLLWQPAIDKPGTYYLWVRCRSGWHQDKYISTKPGNLRIKLDKRPIETTALRETLAYHGDGENFVWFQSEPLNLDKGEVTISLSSAWEWMHVDKLALAPEGAFKPVVGNVEAMAQTAGKLSVWRASSPYLMPEQIEKETPQKCDALRMEAPRGGTAYVPVLLRNEPDAKNTAELVVSLHMPAGNPLIETKAIQILRLTRTGMRIGSALAMDALPEINQIGSMTLPPGRTEMLWLMARISPDIPAGEYQATIQFENQANLEMTPIPVTIRVNDVTLPASPDIVTYNWWGFYNSWWGGPEKLKPYWDDEIAHGTNSFRVQPYREVKYEFDSAGELVGEMDFSHLALHVEYLKKTGGYILIEWDQGEKNLDGLQCKFPGAKPGANLAFMSAAWQRAYKTFVLGITEYLASRGIPRDRILQYPFDEYMGKNFVRVGKFLRQWDSRLKIFADLSAPMDVYRRVAPYVDVWCPVRRDLTAMAEDGRLEFMKKHGKVWTYEPGYLQRGFPPYECFRLPFWDTYHHNLDGCVFWKYMGDRVGAVYYPWNIVYGTPPVTSRRWEAWWSGIQDYMLLKKLEAVAKSKSSNSAVAAKLIKTATNDVISNREDTTLADKYRRAMMEFLEKETRNND
ncbi:MAG: hypothetical protein JXA11_09140 [Phycisphaerae bacterium]|nr:hypothetical protein [Phycisphaerae bacterium]